MFAPLLTRTRSRWRLEVVLVLALSLGQSAWYALLDLAVKLSAGPLREQTTALNPPASPRPYVDLAYQVTGILFTLVPVLLVIWLLADTHRRPWRWLGLDARRPWSDAGTGLALAALVGIPGLGLYLLGRHLGITTTVVPAPDTAYWWSIPILLLHALKNAVVEEVIVVGYLLTRLRQLRCPPWLAIVGSALLRGTYHLYQGFGAGIGNVVMGLLFGWWFTRRGRVMPLVIAHALIDIVAFIGYGWARQHIGWL